jgi:hypothetical protein
MRCEAGGRDDVVVELRCSECMAWLEATLTREAMRELDRRQADFRALLVSAYQASVKESMSALAECLAEALALDLVTADDFAPRRAPRARAA